MKARQANRRSFLQILGLSPFVVTEAAGDTARLMGISPTGHLPSPDSIGLPTTDEFDPSIGNELLRSNVRHFAEDVSKKLAIAQHFKAILRTSAIPDYVHDELRRKAATVHCLDHDIANKRSWSWSIKMTTQRQRNYERLLQAIHDDIRSYETKVAFWKTYGFNIVT